MQCFLPKGGQSAFEAGYVMGNSSFKKNSGTEVTQSTSSINLEYNYGVDNQMSLGAAINTGTNTFESTPVGSTIWTSKHTGLSDLMLNLRMSMGSWFYGADLGLPLANEVSNSDDGTGNRSSGGISVIPMGGLLLSNGSMNFGAYASYTYLMDQKHETKSATSSSIATYSGGSYLTLTPFVEWNYGGGFVTGEFSLNSFSDTTIKSETGTTTTIKADNINVLKVGATYNFTESITGLVNYSVYMVAANSDQGIPAYNYNFVNLGARFVF